jgi:CDP-diacylglycerol--glycerol-3-phosphate 3-phosphatidyltransferase
MNWKLPNQLTIARIALAGVFFTLLGLVEPGAARDSRLLNAAFVIYIVAGITDILDGWIARKYNWTSAFGRIADPFVDKVLVVGAFAMLCGANFQLQMTPGSYESALPQWLTGHMVSAVQAWMVVVIMSREFIVSAVRGYSESQGIKFPATSAGKIKMFIQSLAICSTLYQLANLQEVQWAIITKIILVWLSVIATVASGLAYVGKARKVLLADE